jgi:hypothetical protein
VSPSHRDPRPRWTPGRRLAPLGLVRAPHREPLNPGCAGSGDGQSATLLTDRFESTMRLGECPSRWMSVTERSGQASGSPCSKPTRAAIWPTSDPPARKSHCGPTPALPSPAADNHYRRRPFAHSADNRAGGPRLPFRRLPTAVSTSVPVSGLRGAGLGSTGASHGVKTIFERVRPRGVRES